MFALSHHLIFFGKAGNWRQDPALLFSSNLILGIGTNLPEGLRKGNITPWDTSEVLPASLLTPQRPRRQLAPARDTNQWGGGEILWRWEAIRLTVHNRHTERRGDSMKCHVTTAKGLRTSRQGSFMIRTSHVQKKSTKDWTHTRREAERIERKNRKSYEKGDENEMSFSEL